ncbi:MAG: signal peptidase I [Blastocatellia bacterium]
MRAYDSIKAERGHEVNLETPDFLEHARQYLSKRIPVEIRMSGSSMSPAIEDGDLVTVEPLEVGALRAGDIVLYNSLRDTAVIHRIIKVERGSGERSVLTRGDAASQNDIAVPQHRILGRVKLIERAGERINVTPSKYKARYGLLGWLRRLKFWAR